jgi:hypothetical protein
MQCVIVMPLLQYAVSLMSSSSVISKSTLMLSHEKYQSICIVTLICYRLMALSFFFNSNTLYSEKSVGYISYETKQKLQTIWCASKEEYTYICQYAYWGRQVVEANTTFPLPFVYDSEIEPSTVSPNNGQLNTARERVTSDVTRAGSDVRSLAEDRSSAAGLRKVSSSV